MYFGKFPLIPYQISTQDSLKLVPDILRRVKIRESLRSGSTLFDNKTSLDITFPFTVDKEIVNKLITKTEDDTFAYIQKTMYL